MNTADLTPAERLSNEMLAAGFRTRSISERTDLAEWFLRRTLPPGLGIYELRAVKNEAFKGVVTNGSLLILAHLLSLRAPEKTT